jgi:hypothetical protein
MFLTSLHLIVGLIIILILSTIFKPSIEETSEGFATLPNGLVDSNAYYQNLVKIAANDELYYDPPSGNIYLFTPDDSTTGVSSATNNKVYNVKLIAPTGETITYKTTDTLSTTQKTLIQAKIALTTSSWQTLTPRTSLIYFAKNQYTFLYVMDLAAVVMDNSVNYVPSYNVSNLYLYNGATLQVKSNLNKSISLVKPRLYSVYSADPNDSKDSIDPMYDSVRTVHQLTKNVKYDKKNGNLLLCYTDSSVNKIDVFTRGSDTVNYTLTGTAPSGGTDASKIVNLDETYNPKIIQNDKYGKFSVVYWPNSKNTLVMVLENFCDIVGLSGRNKGVAGLAIVYYSTDSTSSTSSGTSGSTTSGTSSTNTSVTDQFNRWSQYMLKTQVVPPVCPACPSCQSGSSTGVCTNCGGQGGSGSKDATNESLAYKKQENTVGGVANKAISTTGGVINNTVDNAAGLGAMTVAGATGLGAMTIGAAAGTVDSAAGLVGGTIGTAADLLKSAGKGAQQLLSGRQTDGTEEATRIGYKQSYGYNRNNTGLNTLGTSNSQLQYGMDQKGGAPIDVYSYGGALQSKGSNFRPLTADFSAFGK